ncbi:hypothetical protein FBU30_006289 [Linnemannia zychae]|nr:hypothetical protein FBU30_006289 [Linnemannia zychae]
MNNSWFCGLQGAFLMYLVLVLLCLSFLLIANLHLLTVYRSKLIQIYLTKLMAFSFFLPLSLVVPVIVKKQIMNPGFGSICFVGPDVASAYFFFPLSIVVCIATLLHLGTIGFMIKTAIRANSTSSVGNSHSLSVGNSSSGNTNATMSSRQRRLQTARDISHLIKQQWRPGLLALFLLIVDMIYWLFYFIEAKKLESVGPNTTWFQQWVGCLAEQAIKSVKEGRLSMTNSSPAEFLAAGEIAQRTCAGISTPFVPNFAWAALSDLLPALFGFVLLFIFGSKMELWHDLREHLFGQHDKNDNKITMDNISKKNRDKIYDNKDSLSGFNNNNSSSISPAVSPVNPAATAGNPLRQERYQRNLKITTQLAHDNFYDDDFTQYDNPNSSRTNLTPTSSMPSPKTRNGGPILKNQGDYTINNNSPSNSKNVNIFASSDKMYHSETPEPWKPSAWIIGSAAQDDYTIQTAHRSMSPQLRINAHNSASPRIIAVGESLSPRSPPRKFYNSDDLTPTSSTTPPLIYNNNTPKAPSQNGRGSNNGYSTVGGQSNGVGGENSSHNKPDVNVDPRVQNYQRYQQQEPQSTSRVLSPAPSRPNKSIARIR